MENASPHDAAISDNLARVAPSATIAVTQAARDMRARGIDVIGLGAGEPDFDTPDHIKEAAIKAIRDGETNYTNVDGIMPLKDAISAKFLRDNNLSYDPAQISVAPGGKPILFNAFMATLNAGDEVIVPTPSWVSYPEMVRLTGGTPIMLTGRDDNGFKITADDLRAAITPQTRWLILNSPSNPTGAVYTPAELKALGAVLEAHPKVMILTDDIYEHLVYGDSEFHTLADVMPSLLERVLTMNGMSKAYAMTGWRIGYAGGPEWLIKAMAKVMSQSTSNPCSISQWASVAALNGSHDFLAPWKAAYVARRDHVVRAINAMTGLSCQTPDGAFYAYPNCEAVIGRTTRAGTYIDSDTTLAKALLSESHVAIVPGTAFHAAPYFRLSYATDMQTLQTATQRMAEFFSDLKD